MEIITTTKIINRDGIKAIRNGQKLNRYADIPSPKKPRWLKVKAEFNPNFYKVKEQVHGKQFVKRHIVQILASAGQLEQQLLCLWGQFVQELVSFVRWIQVILMDGLTRMSQ